MWTLKCVEWANWRSFWRKYQVSTTRFGVTWRHKIIHLLSCFEAFPRMLPHFWGDVKILPNTTEPFCYKTSETSTSPSDDVESASQGAHRREALASKVNNCQVGCGYFSFHPFDPFDFICQKDSKDMPMLFCQMWNWGVAYGIRIICPALDLVTGNMIPFADRKVNCCFPTKQIKTWKKWEKPRLPVDLEKNMR